MPILAGAQKLTQVAHLRREVMLPEFLAIQRVGSQSSFTRFFQGFTTAGKNLRAFRPLWHWAMERLTGRKEGYSLDLDSTRLLHEDGRQRHSWAGFLRSVSRHKSLSSGKINDSQMPAMASSCDMLPMWAFGTMIRWR